MARTVSNSYSVESFADEKHIQTIRSWWKKVNQRRLRHKRIRDARRQKLAEEKQRRAEEKAAAIKAASKAGPGAVIDRLLEAGFEPFEFLSDIEKRKQKEEEEERQRQLAAEGAEAVEGLDTVAGTSEGTGGSERSALQASTGGDETAQLQQGSSRVSHRSSMDMGAFSGRSGAGSSIAAGTHASAMSPTKASHRSGQSGSTSKQTPQDETTEGTGTILNDETSTAGASPGPSFLDVAGAQGERWIDLRKTLNIPDTARTSASQNNKDDRMEANKPAAAAAAAAAKRPKQSKPKPGEEGYDSVGSNTTDSEVDVAEEKKVAPLKELVLGGCNITDRGLRHLARWPFLEKLSLRSCSSVTDEGAKAMLSSLTSLTDLDLNECRKITDSSIVLLARSSSNLKRLNLTGVWEVNTEALESLTKPCRNVEVSTFALIPGAFVYALHAVIQALYVNSCPRVTDWDLRRLEALWPKSQLAWRHRGLEPAPAIVQNTVERRRREKEKATRIQQAVSAVSSQLHRVIEH